MNARSVFHDLHSKLATFLENGESRTIAYLLLDQIGNISKEDVIAEKGVNFASEDHFKLDGYISRLQNQEPIQYILGFTEFHGRKFKVDQNVLIPRPETEELAQWCIDENDTPNPDILDIGTGSGCIAITLKMEIPKSNVHALDCSPKALITASENAKAHGCEIKFYEKDILEDNLNDIKLDIIISNPPYVRRSEATLMADRINKFEPHEALFVDDFNPLVFYKRIILLARENLKKGGEIYFEINEAFGAEVRNLFTPDHFKEIDLREDINGKYRMVRAIKC
jgi:release factor glutamine methyltransferase